MVIARIQRRTTINEVCENIFIDILIKKVSFAFLQSVSSFDVEKFSKLLKMEVNRKKKKLTELLMFAKS